MPLIYQMSDIVKAEDTPLLTDDGLLTDASEGTSTNIEVFLKNLKIPY